MFKKHIDTKEMAITSCHMKPREVVTKLVIWIKSGGNIFFHQIIVTVFYSNSTIKQKMDTPIL
jgi:hypothetical protein